MLLHTFIQMIETWWNIIFNILFALTPVSYIFYDETTFMITLRPLISNTCFCYYIMDIIWEIVNYNRYFYIPHHIVTMYQFYIFKYGDYSYEQFKLMLFTFAILEYTTIFSNIRDHLKQQKNLSIYFDIFMSIQYFYIRCYLFPYYTFNYLLHYYVNIFPKITNIILIIMSYYWLLLWSKTLIKQINKKICKLSTIL